MVSSKYFKNIKTKMAFKYMVAIWTQPRQATRHRSTIAVVTFTTATNITIILKWLVKQWAQRPMDWERVKLIVLILMDHINVTLIFFLLLLILACLIWIENKTKKGWKGDLSLNPDQWSKNGLTSQCCNTNTATQTYLASGVSLRTSSSG